MFVRAKKSGKYKYLQLVHNERVDGHIRQQVIATLGRLDRLQQSGQIDALWPPAPDLPSRPLSWRRIAEDRPKWPRPSRSARPFSSSVFGVSWAWVNASKGCGRIAGFSSRWSGPCS